MKRYYVITTGVAGVALERGVAGPWKSKKRAKRFLRQVALHPGVKEIVKAVGK